MYIAKPSQHLILILKMGAMSNKTFVTVLYIGGCQIITQRIQEKHETRASFSISCRTASFGYLTRPFPGHGSETWSLSGRYSPSTMFLPEVQRKDFDSFLPEEL